MRFSYYLLTALVAIASRVGLIGADTLVLLATWFRTYESIRNPHQSSIEGKKTFASVILRDGALCISREGTESIDKCSFGPRDNLLLVRKSVRRGSIY